MTAGQPAPTQNSGRTVKPKGKPRGKSFQKGQSGNPGGRPKIAADVRALAGTHTTAAVDTLARIMLSGESEQSRIAAARELLDRACGKPAQALANADGTNLSIPAVITFLISQQAGAENRS